MTSWIGNRRREERPRTRRAQVLKYVLASGVLLGIGAGATSAAWSDDAWFSSGASSASVELQASTTAAGPWDNADTDPGVTFGTAAFTNLLPNQTRTATIYLRNHGSTCLNVQAPTITKAAPLDGTTVNDATVTVSPAVVGPLAPNDAATATVTVTVTTPSSWAVSHQNVAVNATALKLLFTGTAIGTSSTGVCP